MSGFVNETYFQEVVDAMKKKGFALFSQVTISTEDLPYHVRVNHARDTSYFFHFPNKSLIVKLNYHENDFNCETRGGTRGYWNINVHVEYKPYEEFVREVMVPSHTDPATGEWVDTYFKALPFHETEGEINYPEGFRRGYHWGNCQQEVPTLADDRLDADRIVDGVWGMVVETLPYLQPLPFNGLQVTAFPPYYTFNGCEELFWERFKESSARISSSRYFWSLVTRPWGSDGLKR